VGGSPNRPRSPQLPLGTVSVSDVGEVAQLEGIFEGNPLLLPRRRRAPPKTRVDYWGIKHDVTIVVQDVKGDKPTYNILAPPTTLWS